jgi:phosphatidylglycerol:prolipoprotein diacylglycerol transferase
MTILFYLPGDIPVYVSPILFGLGGTIGLGWIAWRTPAESRIRYLDAGLWALLGALLGGRLLFVFLNWAYFQLHPAEIPLFFLGGFSMVGAYLGSFLALMLVALITKLNFGNVSDAILPLLGILTASAWLACWLDGCAYGKITAAWWGLPAKDEWGIVATRMPIQLVAALGSAVWTMFLLSGPIKMKAPGTSAYLGVFGYSVIALAISLMLSDPTRYWLGLRYDSLGSIFLIGLSAIAFLVALLFGRRNPQTDDTPFLPE